MKLYKDYLEILERNIYSIISQEIRNKSDVIKSIVNENLFKSHILNEKSYKFQKFYMECIDNKNFYDKPNFFINFKTQYSLQGINKRYLQELEEAKEDIYSLIKENKLTELYFTYFKKAKLNYKGKDVFKDLNSFFTKLVHTFNPTNYCALDNPIKNYFGLNSESFFISFIIISSAYKKWVMENQDLIKKIKDEFEKKIKNENINICFNEITDLKLLDLIFWSKANQTNKEI